MMDNNTGPVRYSNTAVVPNNFNVFFQIWRAMFHLRNKNDTTNRYVSALKLGRTIPTVARESGKKFDD